MSQSVKVRVAEEESKRKNEAKKRIDEQTKEDNQNKRNEQRTGVELRFRCRGAGAAPPARVVVEPLHCECIRRRFAEAIDENCRGAPRIVVLTVVPLAKQLKLIILNDLSGRGECERERVPRNRDGE